MQWFRMYAEYATDPKVQSMDETLQRRFTMFLCLHCNGEYDRLSDEELACSLRISMEELTRTQAVFRGKGFLGENNEIRNWNKRQYKSDDVSSRVKKHRDEKKKQACNVSVSPSETDSESDTEKNKKTPSESRVAQERDDTPTTRIFAHWCGEFRHPKASLDPKRRRAIQRALEAYDEATVCAAISGYKLSPHHMGQNDQRTIYDDISLFLRDAEHIERGLNFARAPPVAVKSAVQLMQERLRGSNGDRSVVSEQFGAGERDLGAPGGMLRRLPDS